MKQLSIGNVIDGRYRLDDQVGAGGMGIVYRARDLKLDRDVAIKFLLGAKLDTHFKARFIEEARILARLEHPNILQLFDFGTSQETPYIVCEYLDGRTIIEHVEMTGALPLAKVKKWSQQLFSAMAYAHDEGVLHRDLKGENVMVTEKSQIRVMDFGLARREDRATKLTETGAVMGTATYVSPEVILGNGASKASDIYSAGVILYEMLVGVPPFGGTSSFDVLQAHLIDKPPDPAVLREDLPSSVSYVIKKTLKKKPEERYQDFASLEADFTAALEDKKLVPTAKEQKNKKRKSSFLLKKSGTFSPIDQSKKRRSWILLLLSPAILFLAVFIAYPFLSPSLLPKDMNSVKQELSPQSATISWQVSGRGTVPYLLKLEGSLITRGNSQNEGNKQVVSLRGLLPGHSYVLTLGTDETKQLDLQFSTQKAKFINEPFTAVLNDTLVMEYETNLDRGLNLQVSKSDRTILATEKNCPTKGTVVVEDLAVGPMVRPIHFQLSLNNEVIAHGTTLTRPQALSALRYPKGPRSKLSNRNARVGHFWVGRYFVYADIDGTLFCFQLNRTTIQSERAPTFRLCWLLAPPRINGVLHLRRHMTFAPIDDNTLIVIAPGIGGKMKCRLIDIEERCQQWQKITGGRNLNVFPEWALDKRDKWNGPLGKREWIKDLDNFSPTYFLRKMAVFGDNFIVLGMKPNHLIASSLTKVSGVVNWEQTIGLAEIIAAPAFKIGEKTTVFTQGVKRGIDIRGKNWDFHSRPLVLKDRLYTVISTAASRKTDRGNLRPCCLASFPLKSLAANKPLVCFRFYLLARRLELALSRDKERLLVIGPDNIFEWAPGQSGNPKFLRTSSLFKDGRYGYNSGSILYVGNKPYFTRYQFRTTDEAPDGGLVGNFFASPHLCTIEEQGNKRFLLRYFPTLLDESDERPGQIIDLVGHGNLIVGQSRRAMFCLDTTSLSWSSYTISNIDRTVGFSISQEEIIGTAQATGNVTAIPLRALVARMRGHLRPNARVLLPSDNNVLR